MLQVVFWIRLGLSVVGRLSQSAAGVVSGLDPALVAPWWRVGPRKGRRGHPLLRLYCQTPRAVLQVVFWMRLGLTVVGRLSQSAGGGATWGDGATPCCDFIASHGGRCCKSFSGCDLGCLWSGDCRGRWPGLSAGSTPRWSLPGGGRDLSDQRESPLRRLARSPGEVVSTTGGSDVGGPAFRQWDNPCQAGPAGDGIRRDRLPERRTDRREAKESQGVAFAVFKRTNVVVSATAWTSPEKRIVPGVLSGTCSRPRSA